MAAQYMTQDVWHQEPDTRGGEGRRDCGRVPALTKHSPRGLCPALPGNSGQLLTGLCQRLPCHTGPAPIMLLGLSASGPRPQILSKARVTQRHVGSLVVSQSSWFR